MTSTAPSTKRLESSTPSETAIRWPTTELLLSVQRPPQRGRIDADHPGRDRPAFAFGQQPVRHVELFRRQSARPAHTLSAPPGRPYPRLGSFADQLALELGKGGEHAKD